jgi:hypothetical protein
LYKEVRVCLGAKGIRGEQGGEVPREASGEDGEEGGQLIRARFPPRERERGVGIKRERERDADLAEKSRKEDGVVTTRTKNGTKTRSMTDGHVGKGKKKNGRGRRGLT